MAHRALMPLADPAHVWFVHRALSCAAHGHPQAASTPFPDSSTQPVTLHPQVATGVPAALGAATPASTSTSTLQPPPPLRPGSPASVTPVTLLRPDGSAVIPAGAGAGAETPAAAPLLPQQQSLSTSSAPIPITVGRTPAAAAGVPAAPPASSTPASSLLRTLPVADAAPTDEVAVPGPLVAAPVSPAYPTPSPDTTSAPTPGSPMWPPGSPGSSTAGTAAGEAAGDGSDDGAQGQGGACDWRNGHEDCADGLSCIPPAASQALGAAGTPAAGKWMARWLGIDRWPATLNVRDRGQRLLPALSRPLSSLTHLRRVSWHVYE